MNVRTATSEHVHTNTCGSKKKSCRSCFQNFGMRRIRGGVCCLSLSDNLLTRFVQAARFAPRNASFYVVLRAVKSVFSCSDSVPRKGRLTMTDPSHCRLGCV